MCALKFAFTFALSELEASDEDHHQRNASHGGWKPASSD